MSKFSLINTVAIGLLRCLLVCSVLMLLPRAVHSQHHSHGANTSPLLDKDKSLSLSQSVIGKPAGNYQFVNQDGKRVSLFDYRGKPLVVNFIYTSCYHTCPVMTAHLNDVQRIARDAVGEDAFTMVSIGFDTEVDSPESMRLFAAQRNVNFEGWDFLSGDNEAINGITRDMGFSFVRSPNGFDHLAQTTILDANGVIYRQVYGATFDTPALVEPLKELVFGKHGNSSGVKQWINSIKLFCTVYDPSSNRYYFDYSIFYIVAIGLLCLVSILAFIIISWREHAIKATSDK